MGLLIKHMNNINNLCSAALSHNKQGAKTTSSFDFWFPLGATICFVFVLGIFSLILIDILFQ